MAQTHLLYAGSRFLQNWASSETSGMRWNCKSAAWLRLGSESPPSAPIDEAPDDEQYASRILTSALDAALVPADGGPPGDAMTTTTTTTRMEARQVMVWTRTSQTPLPSPNRMISPLRIVPTRIRLIRISAQKRQQKCSSLSQPQSRRDSFPPVIRAAQQPPRARGDPGERGGRESRGFCISRHVVPRRRGRGEEAISR